MIRDGLIHRHSTQNQTSYYEQDEQYDADDLLAELEVFVKVFDHLKEERDQEEQQSDDEKRFDGVIGRPIF